MDLKKRIEKLEQSSTVPIGKSSFVYRMAKEQDKSFEGDGKEAVSLMMKGLKKRYSETQ